MGPKKSEGDFEVETVGRFDERLGKSDQSREKREEFLRLQSFFLQISPPNYRKFQYRPYLFRSHLFVDRNYIFHLYNNPS